MSEDGNLESLRCWTKTCQHLLRDWTRVINLFPSEVHHIEPIFLAHDSCFRREYNNSPQCALPACASLIPKPVRTPFEGLWDEKEMICILEESCDRMYVTKRERRQRSWSYSSGSKPPPNWTIHCHSLDTSFKIAKGKWCLELHAGGEAKWIHVKHWVVWVQR
jgi:hypothetical protein